MNEERLIEGYLDHINNQRFLHAFKAHIALGLSVSFANSTHLENPPLGWVNYLNSVRCISCGGGFQIGLVGFLPCGHFGHVNCIIEDVFLQGVCPLCGNNISRGMITVPSSTFVIPSLNIDTDMDRIISDPFFT